MGDNMKVFAFLLFSLVIIAVPLQSVAEEDATWLRTKADCTTLIAPEAKGICERVMESREILSRVEPGLIADPKGRVFEREIVIVAWDAENTPHQILLKVPFRVKKASDLKVTVMTDGYKVERVRGTGLYKLQFRVFKDETELFVFGGKHVWIPHAFANEWSQTRLVAVAETRQYLPSSQDHLFHEELSEKGKSYLEAHIDNARGELADVPSRAVPGASLQEVYPREMTLNLMVTEHTDPYLLFGERKEGSLPASSYFLGTLIEFALHGPEAFADLCSSALPLRVRHSRYV